MTAKRTTLIQDAKALRKLKLDAQKATKLGKDLATKHAIAEARFIERLEAEEAEGVKTGGINFVPAVTVYGQIQDRAAFVEWAQENAPELVEIKERKGEVSEFVRARLDDGEGLPPGLGYYEKAYISQRSA